MYRPSRREKVDLTAPYANRPSVKSPSTVASLATCIARA
jgi:hypothetical protein